MFELSIISYVYFCENFLFSPFKDASCKGKANNSVNAEDCFTLYTCINGDRQNDTKCSGNKPWAGAGECVADPPSGCDADCLGKADGEKNETGCSGYFECNGGVKKEYNCTGNDTFFDPSSKSCSQTAPQGCEKGIAFSCLILPKYELAT